MVATQRSKKRGQRKRNQQPKRRKSKGRKPQLKQKTLPFKGGRKVRPKPAVRRGQGLKRPYDLYVSKILKQLHQDKVPMSTKAKGAMISYVRKIYNKVSSAAECHRKTSGHCTIGSKELQSALRRVMPKKVAKNLATSIYSNSPP